MKEFDIKTIQDMMNKISDGLEDRKGYIMMPSLNGFDLYEIPEDRLKSYLYLNQMAINNEVKQ